MTRRRKNWRYLQSISLQYGTSSPFRHKPIHCGKPFSVRIRCRPIKLISFERRFSCGRYTNLCFHNGAVRRKPASRKAFLIYMPLDPELGYSGLGTNPVALHFHPSFRAWGFGRHYRVFLPDHSCLRSSAMGSVEANLHQSFDGRFIGIVPCCN